MSRTANRIGCWIWAGLCMSLGLGTLAAETSPSAPDLRPRRNILVLHSYHHGMRWTDSITEGIESVFLPSNIETAVYYDFMDTKRISTPAYFEEFSKLLAMKYRPDEFQLVICSDDDAFDFLRRFRQKLFGATPVVFCGVNYFQESMLDGQSNITGVVESYDLESTVDVALRFHPSTKRILVINDRTVTGKANDKRVEAIRPLYSDRVAFDFVGNEDMAGVLRQVEQLPADGLVLLMSFNRDRDGRLYRYRDAARLICTRSPVPVYGVWSFYLGDGIVGGRLTSGFAHGRKAAEFGLRILEGQPADSIEICRELPGVYMFDDQELTRWGIPPASLPAGSLVIHRPPMEYLVSKRVVWSVLGGLGLLIFAGLIYAGNLRTRLAAQHALRQANDDLRVAIRERRTAQEDRERLASALEQTADAVVITDPSYAIQYVNPAFQRITGYAPGEVEGKGLDTLLVTSERDVWAAEIRETLQRGEPWSGHVVNRRRDGCFYEEEVVISPVRSAGGAITHFVAIKRDVTEKMLLQSQLQEAQKIETVGRIAGAIAHDFNNMLTVILNSAQFLAREGPSGARGGRDIEEIILTAHRASALTRELLAFSRRQPIQTAVLDLNEVVRGMQNMLQRIMGDKGGLQLQLAHEACLVLADKNRMEQAVANLVVNARDAVEARGRVIVRTVRVALAKEPRGDLVEPPEHMTGEYIRLSVEDNGTGMTDEVRRRIFEPYFTTKSSQMGTGLGLSVVYGIVKQHGGRMGVQTALGAGSTFKIYLPAAAGDAATRPAAIPSVREPPGKETILVAEDEPAVRDILVRIMRSLGYTVLAADSGEAAIKLAAERPGAIDLLFTDVVMPGMDGPNLARQLQERYPGLKVIFASGYSRDYLANVADSLKSAPLLKKPFEAGEVARLVRRVLDGRAEEE